MADIKVMFARLDERINAISMSVATKSDIDAVRISVAQISGELRGKLGFWRFLGVVLAIGALMVKWPELFRSVGIC